MHVDDALYADIARYMVHTICISILALFWLLGFPSTPPVVPSPLSAEKFEAYYNHQRKLVGRRFNSRTLSVGLLDYKRERLITLLSVWISKGRYDLLEISHLLGTLENHTRYARWARCWYFTLQNAVRRILFQRFKIVDRIYNRKGREATLRQQLPSDIEARVHSLIVREKAQLLWSTRQKFLITDEVKASLQHLLIYTQTGDPWEVPLGLIIPREPHFISKGDASFVGGGAYSEELRFWFDIGWSARTIKGATQCKPAAAGYIHINSLEFIIVIIQLAAVITRLDSISSGTASGQLYFPHGVPDIPVWLGKSDNSVSVAWENRATSSSSQGQGLVSIYAELLRREDIHTKCQHLAGSLNIVADGISRNDFSLPFSLRSQKLFKEHPMLGTLDYFLPSPDLLLLLTSRLYSRLNPVPCVLPQQLGQFLPAGSTTSISVTL